MRKCHLTCCFFLMICSFIEHFLFYLSSLNPLSFSKKHWYPNHQYHLWLYPQLMETHHPCPSWFTSMNWTFMASSNDPLRAQWKVEYLIIHNPVLSYDKANPVISVDAVKCWGSWLTSCMHKLPGSVLFIFFFLNRSFICLQTTDHDIFEIQFMCFYEIAEDASPQSAYWIYTISLLCFGFAPVFKEPWRSAVKTDQLRPPKSYKSQVASQSNLTSCYG